MENNKKESYMEHRGKEVFRFAPSNTGTLHIGSARTALFNFLLARNRKAKFILRIEDTDSVRSTKEFEDNIVNGLKWLGIEWDEFHRQSERTEIYLRYAEELIARDLAYREDEAIKFRVVDTVTSFNDLIRGEINFDMSLQEDFTIIKSDGKPAFLWANVVDDYEMGITHVIRGEDHISNTPKQFQLYQAMGWETPNFGHLSIILGMDRAKLSKRNGAKSVGQFQTEGYLSEALVNFVALLGWSHSSSKEILTRDELISEYTIDRVSKSNSIFDPSKLEWFNREYIKLMSVEEFSKYVDHDVPLAEMIKDRVVTLADIPKLTKFKDKIMYTEPKPSWVDDFVSILKDFHGSMRDSVLTYIRDFGVPQSDVYSNIRYGISGETSGLPMFQLMEYLGKREVVKRLNEWRKA
ncbi:MAG: glutamate--tRNA ligase family protein [Candidatus Pacebacteria bacterium]|nr:glutamate--tRNA ligase family protein [Candidatus Paceibacterota bacterium]